MPITLISIIFCQRINHNDESIRKKNKIACLYQIQVLRMLNMEFNVTKMWHWDNKLCNVQHTHRYIDKYTQNIPARSINVKNCKPQFWISILSMFLVNFIVIWLLCYYYYIFTVLCLCRLRFFYSFFSQVLPPLWL